MTHALQIMHHGRWVTWRTGTLDECVLEWVGVEYEKDSPVRYLTADEYVGWAEQRRRFWAD